MPYVATYSTTAPERAELDAGRGILLLEFGVDWCPHCQNAQAAIEQALAAQPALPHIKVEDGAGRRLGRSFRVKLWPTLILLRDGVEVGRVVRPLAADEIADLLALRPAAP
ncbi:thioredoxin family protein [Vogesella indigofera]|uniref:thioredoxin family protein n=1 Tax=Vogesella indigofera TaxID=45465 RepID=UPI00234F1B6A|nr:thioredoxin family protein [Vogesella indigofera]MDC7708473.1 thioredoxin family protein [Vogesella indigofera]